MKNAKSTTIFYLGTFITSFGSLLIVMCIPAFFIKTGYTAQIVGLAIGVHRFSGIAASALFGPRVDRYNSRNVIFTTEIFAALTSLCLVIAWYYREAAGLSAFLLLIGLRSFIVGVQSSSRSRIIKLLSMDNKEREAGFVIWLNKVTQGAHVISSLVAIPLVATGNLYIAIAIDGLSFIVGGSAALILPDIDSENKQAIKSFNIFKAIFDLIKMHRSIFFQDQMLALAVSGTILLMVKLSGENANYIIYFNLLFGSCIWLSSIFVHNVNLRSQTTVYWFVILVGFSMLSSTYLSEWKFAAFFITYMGYWILYHKYTVEIQTKTPKEMIGATMAARGLAIAFTLSVGELFGGYITQIFNLKTELIGRATVCVFALSTILITKIKMRRL
jgi:hypothetical protein